LETHVDSLDCKLPI